MPTPFEVKQASALEMMAERAQQQGSEVMARHYRNRAYLLLNPNPLPYKRLETATAGLAELRDMFRRAVTR